MRIILTALLFFAIPAAAQQSTLDDQRVETLLNEIETLFVSDDKDDYERWFDLRAAEDLAIRFDSRYGETSVTAASMNNYRDIHAAIRNPKFEIDDYEISDDGQNANGTFEIETFAVNRFDNGNYSLRRIMEIECGFDIALRVEKPRFTVLDCAQDGY